MSVAPEFSRPERIDSIGEGERTVTIAADAAERQALADRFGLTALDRLEGVFRLRREAGEIVARGRVRAAVTQSCVVTGAAIPVTIDEPVALRFVARRDSQGDEIELDEDDLDTIEFDGGAIDLGEAAAETMALALDPFPRSPGAAAALRAAGVIGEDEAAPLGALAGLKARLEGR